MLWCLQHQCSVIGPLKVPVETCNICREFLAEMVREFTVVQRRWMLEQRLLGRNLIAIQLGYAAMSTLAAMATLATTANLATMATLVTTAS